MNELMIRRADEDGASTLYDVGLGSINVQSKGFMVHVRSAGELRLLMQMKQRYQLDGIEGALVDLTIAPRAFSKLRPAPSQESQSTFEGRIYHDPFTEFTTQAFLFGNPRMEYLYLYRGPIDDHLRKGYAEIKGINEYLDEYRTRVDSLPNDTLSNRQKVRHAMYYELFFSTVERQLKRRDATLGELMRLQKATDLFNYAVPASPLTDADADQQACAEDINDKCQSIAYGLNMRWASYFMYTKKALKDRKIMNAYFDYIERKGSRLNIINFSELDLDCPPDMRGRLEFAEFGKRITALRSEEEHKKKLFMLIGAGKQTFIGLESFDFVSTAPTRIDKLIGWSKGRTLGYWYHDTLMATYPPEDITINREHCPSCQRTTDSDMKDPKKENQRRREHGIHDLNILSTEYRYNIRSKGVGAYLRRRLSASEFSGFQVMIQSP